MTERLNCAPLNELRLLVGLFIVIWPWLYYLSLYFVFDFWTQLRENLFSKPDRTSKIFKKGRIKTYLKLSILKLTNVYILVTMILFLSVVAIVHCYIHLY